MEKMAESDSQQASEPKPNIFSLNKKLKDTIAGMDSRFKSLETRLESCFTNTDERLVILEEKLEKMEERNINIEKILAQIQILTMENTRSDKSTARSEVDPDNSNEKRR